MSIEQIVPGVFQVPISIVNAFLLVGEDVAVIDTGVPGSASKILEAVGQAGRTPRDIRHILLTHLHADHVGSAGALQEAVAQAGGLARIYMHASDAQAFQQGVSMRPVRSSPGIWNWLIVNLFLKRRGPQEIEPAVVDCLVTDGAELPIAGGLKVIHAPGHTAGSVVLLWPQHGGVLFAGDACGRRSGRLGYPHIFEDPQAGRATLRMLGEFRSAWHVE